MAAVSFRTIDPEADRALVVANFRATHRASYGAMAKCSVGNYLPWLRSRIEEYPDGHVLAFAGRRCIGQLELQVPYGLSVGYVNLFFITSEFRGQGFGRRLSEYADHYFTSWEADRAELHVAANNTQAVGFYRHMNYQLLRVEGGLWRMSRSLEHVVRPSPSPRGGEK